MAHSSQLPSQTLQPVLLSEEAQVVTPVPHLEKTILRWGGSCCHCRHTAVPVPSRTFSQALVQWTVPYLPWQQLPVTCHQTHFGTWWPSTLSSFLKQAGRCQWAFRLCSRRWPTILRSFFSLFLFFKHDTSVVGWSCELLNGRCSPLKLLFGMCRNCKWWLLCGGKTARELVTFDGRDVLVHFFNLTIYCLKMDHESATVCTQCWSQVPPINLPWLTGLSRIHQGGCRACSFHDFHKVCKLGYT